MAKKKKKAGPVKGRGTKVASATGITGCGKSYESKRIAKKLATNEKVLVVTYAGSGNTWDMCKKIAPTEKALSFKKGWKKIHYVEHGKDKPFISISEHYKNGLLILDDCKLYLKSNWDQTPGLDVIVIDHRHKGLDIIFIGHSPLHIPKQCWAFIHYSWIFKCTMKLTESLMPMENFEQFIEAQEEVNIRFDKEAKKLNGKKPVGIFKVIKN